VAGLEQRAEQLREGRGRELREVQIERLIDRRQGAVGRVGLDRRAAVVIALVGLVVLVVAAVVALLVVVVHVVVHVVIVVVVVVVVVHVVLVLAGLRRRRESEQRGDRVGAGGRRREVRVASWSSAPCTTATSVDASATISSVVRAFPWRPHLHDDTSRSRLRSVEAAEVAAVEPAAIPTAARVVHQLPPLSPPASPPTSPAPPLSDPSAPPRSRRRRPPRAGVVSAGAASVGPSWMPGSSVWPW